MPTDPERPAPTGTDREIHTQLPTRLSPRVGRGAECGVRTRHVVGGAPWMWGYLHAALDLADCARADARRTPPARETVDGAGARWRLERAAILEQIRSRGGLGTAAWMAMSARGPPEWYDPPRSGFVVSSTRRATRTAGVLRNRGVAVAAGANEAEPA